MKSPFEWASPSPQSVHPPQTLDQVAANTQCILSGFHPGLSESQQNALMGYGLLPGTPVSVLQTTPLVIVQIDHLELALERDVANRIQILA